MRIARDLIAVVLAVIAALLLGASIPAVWLAENVVDEDGFLAIAEPLGSDPQMREALSEEAVSRMLESPAIPDWAADRVEPLAQEQAQKLTGTAAYDRMWAATMREFHHQLFTPGPIALTIDLTPAVEALTQPIEKNLPIEIPLPADLEFTVAKIPRLALLEKAHVLNPWAGRMAPAGLLCAAAALLLARHRRIVLLVTGISGMVSGGLLLWACRDLEGLVPDAVDQAPFLGHLVQAFEAQMAADMRPQAILLCSVSTLVMVGAIILLGLRRS